MTWNAWALDTFTIGWIIWLAFFVIWESAGIVVGVENTLTYHLRPLFVAHPLTWFLTVGLWAWLGFHFLIEAGNPIARGS